jgi:DNA polymerase-3 subunit alpha
MSIGKSIIQISPIKSGEKNKPDQPDNIEDIIADYGFKTLFLCEDNVGGFIPAYKAAKALNCNLVFGWRVSICDDATKKEKQSSSKIIIFVRSEAGWKSLVKLATYGQVDGYFEEARIDWKKLQELWSDELVLAIPHYDGFVMNNLTRKTSTIPDFGKIQPFMFLEDCDMFFDRIIREKTLDYAKAFGLKTVEVKTCYYKNRADLTYFQARKLMDRKSFGSGNTIEEPNMEFFSSAEFCLESWNENKDILGDGESDFEKQFETPLDLFLPGVRLPEFKLDEEDRLEFNIPEGATNIETLRILSRHGYKEKVNNGDISKDRQEEYRQRFEYELDMLDKTSFDSYILLVWMTMRFARKNKLAHGFGRGSSAGSLINYLVGIVDVDPVDKGLYFERFISLSRAKTSIIDGVTFLAGSLCDIDCDYGAEARDKVIEYLTGKYPGKFAKLSTYNTQTTKALLKDAGKVIGGLSEEQVKVYSDEIPVKFGKVARPEAAYEESEKIKQFADNNPEIFGCVKKLQNCIKNFGSHASAYIISYYPLNDFMPLQYGNDGEIVTSADAHVAEISTIKLDLLGLQSVTLFDNIVKTLGIDISKINYESWDDIYCHLQNLESASNLFQISGDSAKRGLNKIKPKSMNDLSAVLAICRPGSFVFLDQYADYVNGVGDKPSVHPLFDEILNKTGGVMIYQESLMALFVKIGFSLSEADDIRRIVGKKKVDEIAQWEQKIYDKCAENNIDIEAGKKLWSLALMSADYLFNFSHSFCYSKLCALSVYLKFNHPSHFFLEALRLSKDKQDQAEEVSILVQEMPSFNLKLLPPSLTKSERDFKLEGPNIRFGLEAIKGISEKSIANIQSFIQKDTANLFEVFQAAQQSKVNSTVISALIECGVLEDLAPFDRQKTVLCSKIWKELTTKEQNYCLENGKSHNFDLISMMKSYLEWIGLNGKPIGKESRLATLRKNCASYFEIYKENSKNPMVSQWLFEKKLLGYCPSITLSELFDEYPDLSKIGQIKTELYEKERLQVVAEVKEIKTGTAKKSGNKYAKITLADETGNIESLFTGDKWLSYLAKFGEPEEGQLIYIRGQKGGGEDPLIFIDLAEIQALKIYSRVSDLNKHQEKEQKALGKSQNIEGAALN